jgi:hypothetical protein
MNVDWAIDRLRDLRNEYTNGERQLLELQERQTHVRDSMLRIAGAIQVLEELVEKSSAFASRVEIVNGEAAVAVP